MYTPAMGGAGAGGLVGLGVERGVGRSGSCDVTMIGPPTPAQYGVLPVRLRLASVSAVCITMRHASARVRVARRRECSIRAGGFRSAIFIAFVVLLFSSAVRAQATFYWDINGNTAGAGGASPSATWSTANADKNWSTSSAGTSGGNKKWTSGNFAVFSAGTDATGAYTVTVSGTQTTAGITVGEGSPVFSGGTISLTGAAPTVSIAASSIATFNSLIASTSGLTKTGTGTMILANTANAYSGATNINAGTLQLGVNNSIPNGSAVSVASGATLDVNSKTETVGSLAGAGNITLSAGALTAGGANTSTTFSGVLSGTNASSFSKTGTGTLTLSGANTFASTVLVSAGTVLAGAQDVFNSANQITVSTGSILNLADFSQTIASLTSNGTLALGPSATDTLTLTGGASMLGGTLTGAGTIIVGLGGSLTLGANFNAPSLNIVLNGGSLFLNGTTDTLGTLSITGNSILDFGPSTNSILTVQNVTFGTTSLALTINNWASLQDYFYSTNFTGATPNVRGATPENQIAFTGFSAANTMWQSSDHQITPMPEPSTYGAIFLAFTTIVVVWRRFAGKG
jgi:autotransporter-associated beta strand protein